MKPLHLKAVAACLLALLVSACISTAKGPDFKPVAASKGGGVIYVYAPDAIDYSIVSARVEVDGKPAGKLQPKGFMAHKVSAGSHTVTLRAGIIGIGQDTKVRVPAGGAVYIRVDPEYVATTSVGQPVYIADPNLVPPSVGRREIKATKLSS